MFYIFTFLNFSYQRAKLKHFFVIGGKDTIKSYILILINKALPSFIT